MKNFGVLTFTLLLLACKGPDGTLDLAKPWMMDTNPPPGPPEYEQGWRDGCMSGMNTYTNNFYKLLGSHELRFDSSMRNNKMYYQAWKDAWLYCVWSLEGTSSAGEL